MDSREEQISEPGQPTSPRVYCPICGGEMEPMKFTETNGYLVMHLECPDRCALAADCSPEELPKT